MSLLRKIFKKITKNNNKIKKMKDIYNNSRLINNKFNKDKNNYMFSNHKEDNLGIK